jgi:hypothetical protein
VPPAPALSPVSRSNTAMMRQQAMCISLASMDFESF